MRRLSKRKEKLANLIDTTNWENREIYCHDYGEKYVLREVRRILAAANSFKNYLRKIRERERENETIEKT